MHILTIHVFRRIYYVKYYRPPSPCVTITDRSGVLAGLLPGVTIPLSYYLRTQRYSFVCYCLLCLLLRLLRYRIVIVACVTVTVLIV